MRNRLLVIVVVIAVCAAACVYAAGSKATKYAAALSGAKEVPPVKTKARGEAIFALGRDSASISYTISVSGLHDPTAAHIHMGAPGANGPVAVVLYPAASAAAPKASLLVNGTITSASLVGPLKGKPLSDLLTAMKSGKAYVNVHTKAHPDGEIRGWISTH